MRSCKRWWERGEPNDRPKAKVETMACWLAGWKASHLDPTPEFRQLGLHFYQDLKVEGKTEDEVWAVVLDPFTGQARIRLRDFLDRITRDDITDAELLSLWNATPADYGFAKGGLRIMLKQACHRLESPPNRPSWRGHDRPGHHRT